MTCDVVNNDTDIFILLVLVKVISLYHLVPRIVIINMFTIQQFPKYSTDAVKI